LLEGLQELRQEDERRLVDEQVDMFRHQEVSIDAGLVTGPSLFENDLKRFLGCRRFKKRKTVEATEGNEVKGFGVLEPLEAVGHIVTP
jgi:hypothetical protein